MGGAVETVLPFFAISLFTFVSPTAPGRVGGETSFVSLVFDIYYLFYQSSKLKNFSLVQVEEAVVALALSAQTRRYYLFLRQDYMVFQFGRLT